MPVGKRLTQHHFEGARWRSSLWKCFMTAWELISYYNSFEWLLTLLKFYLPKKFGRIFVKYMVSFRFEWIMFPFLVEKNLFFQAITVVYFRTSWNSYCLNKNIQPIKTWNPRLFLSRNTRIWPKYLQYLFFQVTQNYYCRNF